MIALLVEPPTFSTIVNCDQKQTGTISQEYIQLAVRVVINRFYIGQIA